MTALGCHVSNPNGNDAAEQAKFLEEFQRFSEIMGRHPSHMNAFVDFNAPVEQWPGNAAWTAWSWGQAGLADVVPMVGIPMSRNWYDDAFLTDTANGEHNATWRGIAQAWFDAGYAHIDVRPGYEMDGNFMAWSTSGGPARIALWREAFKAIATCVRATAAAAGRTCRIIWNPTSIAWTDQPVEACYPGDEYVDEIGVDVYSPQWPGIFFDFASQQNVDEATWRASVANRRHYWTYPSATEWDQEGRPWTGYSLRQAVAFAKAHGKTWSIPETGSDGDEAFPLWLREELDRAAADGAPCRVVMVWGTGERDGYWNFLVTERGALALAWSVAMTGIGDAVQPPAGPPAPAPRTTVTVTDRNGNTAEIDVTVAGTRYASDTNLASNLYVYPFTGMIIMPDNRWDVPTIVVHAPGVLARDFPVATYDN